MKKCLDLGQSSTMLPTGKLNSKQRHHREEMVPKYCRGEEVPGFPENSPTKACLP